MDINRKEVVVTDVKIPFLSLVALLVKIVLAAFPAFLILCLYAAIAMGVLGAIGSFPSIKKTATGPPPIAAPDHSTASTPASDDPSSEHRKVKEPKTPPWFPK